LWKGIGSGWGTRESLSEKRGKLSDRNVGYLFYEREGSMREENLRTYIILEVICFQRVTGYGRKRKASPVTLFRQGCEWSKINKLLRTIKAFTGSPFSARGGRGGRGKNLGNCQ